jgi:hypothetical protein
MKSNMSTLQFIKSYHASKVLKNLLDLVLSKTLLENDS